MDQDGHRNFTGFEAWQKEVAEKTESLQWGFPREMGDGIWMLYIYIHEWDIQYVNWYRILLINSSWTGERWWWWWWCLRQTSEAKPPWVLGKQCLEDQEGHWQRCLWYSTVANHEMYLVGVIVSPFFVGDLIASPQCKESVRSIFAAKSTVASFRSPELRRNKHTTSSDHEDWQSTQKRRRKKKHVYVDVCISDDIHFTSGPTGREQLSSLSCSSATAYQKGLQELLLGRLERLWDVWRKYANLFKSNFWHECICFGLFVIFS